MRGVAVRQLCAASLAMSRWLGAAPPVRHRLLSLPSGVQTCGFSHDLVQLTGFWQVDETLGCLWETRTFELSAEVTGPAERLQETLGALSLPWVQALFWRLHFCCSVSQVRVACVSESSEFCDVQYYEHCMCGRCLDLPHKRTHTHMHTRMHVHTHTCTHPHAHKKKRHGEQCLAGEIKDLCWHCGYNIGWRKTIEALYAFWMLLSFSVISGIR